MIVANRRRKVCDFARRTSGANVAGGTGKSSITYRVRLSVELLTLSSTVPVMAAGRAGGRARTLVGHVTLAASLIIVIVTHKRATCPSFISHNGVTSCHGVMSCSSCSNPVSNVRTSPILGLLQTLVQLPSTSKQGLESDNTPIFSARSVSAR